MSNANYFLAIPGLVGSATLIGFEKQIILESFSLGLTLSMPNMIGSGAGVAKSTPQAFQFTTKVSANSPKLLQACSAGTHFPSAILSVVSVGANPRAYVKYTLTSVLVSSYRMTGQMGSDGIPVDEVSLTFTQAQLDFQTQSATGAAGSTVSSSTNLNVLRKI